jgi:hypothetical protein
VRVISEFSAENARIANWLAEGGDFEDSRGRKPERGALFSLKKSICAGEICSPGIRLCFGSLRFRSLSMLMREIGDVNAAPVRCDLSELRTRNWPPRGGHHNGGDKLRERRHRPEDEFSLTWDEYQRLSITHAPESEIAQVWAHSGVANPLRAVCADGADHCEVAADCGNQRGTAKLAGGEAASLQHDQALRHGSGIMTPMLTSGSTTAFRAPNMNANASNGGNFGEALASGNW